MVLGLMLGLASCALPAQAEERSVGEQELKAALIRNIPLFVQWTTPSPRLQLCVFEASPMGKALAEIVPPSAATTRPIQLQQVSDNPEEWRQCQIFWVDGERISSLGRLAAAARQHSILLLAEGIGTLDRGAMITLSVEGSRILLDVEQGAAQAAGITISSKLLRLARSVRGTRP